jgi:hypothetical protein
MKEKNIATAFLAIAKADHYMVGFVNVATLEELERAKQILIVWSSAKENQDPEIELALDLIEREIKGAKI